jgi:hypothetical protein
LPATMKDLKELGPFEFQNWVIQRVLGISAARKTGDMGVDGWSFFERLPIQVKQSERVGRNAVDNFETAIERTGKHLGYLVAFSFTKGAYEEAARSKEVGKAAVVLVKVSDVLDLAELIEAAEMQKVEPDLGSTPPDLMRLFSAAIKSVRDKRPLPIPSKRGSMPSGNQLIDSAKTKVKSS